MCWIRHCVLAVASLGWAAGSHAAEMQPVLGVVSLSASASVEVAKDIVSIALAATREGGDAQAVQSALKQALDAALGEARKVAKPGQVDVRSGNFSLYPRYGQKGAITGWQGSAELLIEGRDMATIALLTGRISSMTIARVGYGISREQRDRVESEVVAQAVARYRAKATEYAKQFGYTSYVVREVSITTNEPSPIAPMAMARAKTMAVAEEALPIEPGTGTLSANVNGTIQMTK